MMLGAELGPAGLAVRASGGPALELDFLAGRYRRGGDVVTNLAALSGVTFARTGAGVAETAGGGLTAFASGVARVTDLGLLLETERTNRVTVHNANPAGLTGVSKSGEASATLAVVSDAAALAQAGLSSVCGSGQAFKLDNAAGSTVATAIVSAATTSTSPHAVSAYVRGAGSGRIGVQNNGGPIETFGSVYVRWRVVRNPSFVGANLFLSAQPGAVLYFILPQLEAGDAASAPIVTTGAAATRGADALSVVAPAGCSGFTAVYGAGLIATGPVTPGSPVDLTAGRPWIGLGNELKRLEMR